MDALRILTFNWHESYLCLLASAGHEWQAIPRTKAGRSDWASEVRPRPANLRLVAAAEALASLAAGAYDVVVCHNPHDLALVAHAGTPTVTVFHTSLTFERAHGCFLDLDPVRDPLLATTVCVFVSEMKRDSYGREGHVIPHGIDPADYGGYQGDLTSGLTVGNLLAELPEAKGFEALVAIMAGLPFTVIGINPSIPGARTSAGWDDLRETFRRHRVYVNATRAPYEDGYNLAMLEAMATGMPIVSMAHPSSPLRDGVDGYVSADPRELRERVLELLEDPARARTLGAAAAETVRARFPIASFRARWNDLLSAAASRDRRAVGSQPSAVSS